MLNQKTHAFEIGKEEKMIQQQKHVECLQTSSLADLKREFKKECNNNQIGLLERDQFTLLSRSRLSR